MTKQMWASQRAKANRSHRFLGNMQQFAHAQHPVVDRGQCYVDAEISPKDRALAIDRYVVAIFAYEEGGTILKLYDYRREPVMRDARLDTWAIWSNCAVKRLLCPRSCHLRSRRRPRTQT